MKKTHTERMCLLWAAFTLLVVVGLYYLKDATTPRIAYRTPTTPPPDMTLAEPKKIPVNTVNSDATAGVAAEANVRNSWGGQTVISQPAANEVYMLGDLLHIKWNPELIDVSTITIVPADAPDSYDYQIYRRDNLWDGVSTEGEYGYTIPNDLSLYPGSYRVKLRSYASQDGVFVSDPFIVKSPVPIHDRLSKPFYIKDVLGAKTSYKQGENMELNVEAINGDGTFAGEDKSFMVAVLLFDQNNQGLYSATGTYSPSANMWHLSVPMNYPTAYRAQIQLYCGWQKLSSICGQEYPYGTNDSKYITFSVTP